MIADASPFDLLLPYQRDYVGDASRFKCWLKARQIGGSLCTAFEAVADMIETGKDWIAVSAGQRQSRELVRKAGAVVRVFADALGVRLDTHSIGAEVVTWPLNGARFLGFPARPATIRGASGNVILDEFGFHEKPDEIWKAVFPMITNPLLGGLKIRVVSTASGRNTKFFDIVDRAQELGFSLFRTDVHDAVHGGLELDVEELRRAIGDEEAWAQEYLLQFLESSAILLPYDLIRACESPDATTDDDIRSRRHGQLFVGIDIGRTNDLTVAWTLERVGDVLVTREVLELRAVPYEDQQEILMPRVNASSSACIDSTGIGGPVAEHLLARTGSKLEACNFTAPLKAMIFPAMKRMLQGRRVRIPEHEDIREDLHGIQESVTTGGNKIFRATHTKDGHSDRATALALALRAAEKAMHDPSTINTTQGIRIQRSALRRPSLTLA